MNYRPLGIFNYAESYLAAANALGRAELSTTHPDAPIQFLTNHAIELYLKAYLHAKGISEIDLSRNPFGHQLLNLIWEAKKRGLCPKEETYSVVRVLDQMNTQMNSRYLKPRVYRPIREEALDRAVRDLRLTVGKSLKRMGVFVRV